MSNHMLKIIYDLLQCVANTCRNSPLCYLRTTILNVLEAVTAYTVVITP